MIITINISKSCLDCFEDIIEMYNNKLNSIVENIKRQIRVIFMELLRKFNVQLVNKHKKYDITFYYSTKAASGIFPSKLYEIFNNLYVLLKRNLARG